LAFTENNTLKELVDETTLIKDDVTNNRDTLKANLNTIGMDTGGISNLGELIQKVKELYCLDVVPGTDFVYKSDVKELNYGKDLREIRYIEHYKYNNDIFVVFEEKYPDGSYTYYDGYVIKYNFSTGVLESIVLFKKALDSNKLYSAYFLDDFVYICCSSSTFKKISLDDITNIATINLVSNNSNGFYNGCEVKHINDKLYLGIGGYGSGKSSILFKIDINSFTIEKSFSLGSTSSNSSYSLHNLRFMAIETETNCIYLGGMYTGASWGKIFKLDEDLNLISKTEDRSFPGGVSIVKNNLLFIGSSTVSVYDINDNYSSVFFKNYITSLGLTIDGQKSIFKNNVDSVFFFNKGYLLYTKADDYTNTIEFNLPSNVESVKVLDENIFECCTKDKYIEFKRKIV